MEIKEKGDIKMVNENTVNLPEKLDRKVTFASYTMEDLMRGGALFVVFVAIGLIIGNLGALLVFTFLGIIFFWLFGLTKIDGMPFHSYISLRMQHTPHPSLDVYGIKVFEDGVIYDGRWYRIVEVYGAYSLDFMSDADKMYLFSEFRHMLNRCTFPMKIIIHSWKVNPDVFEDYINEDSEIANGYRKLIRENTKDLYLQSFYVLVIATKRDVGSGRIETQYRRAKEILDIYTDTLVKSILALKLNARVMKKHSEIYSAIDEILRGD